MREDRSLTPADAATVPARRFTIGAAVCDLSEGRIVEAGREERLEPRLCGVLALLVQHAPEPVTRDMFLDIVWAGEGSDEALTQSISRLRRLLGDAGAIRTHPRIGYSLERPVRAISALDSGCAEQRTRRWPVRLAAPQWAMIGAMAVVLAVVAGVWIERMRTTPAPGEIEFIEIEQEFRTAPDS